MFAAAASLLGASALAAPAMLVATFAPADVGAVAALGWLGVGAWVGHRLHRDGAGAGVSIAALGVWPLLLGARPAIEGGPLGRRIDAAFDSLTEALADPSAEQVANHGELSALRSSLVEADRRLALVDTLLAEAPSDGPEDLRGSLTRLRAARAHAASEAEAVLSGVLQLRIQVGLRALAGDTVEVSGRLTELRARLSALDELGQLTESP